MDSFARLIVSCGGGTIILAIIGIFVVIVTEFLPLFYDQTITSVHRKRLAGLVDPVSLAVDEYEQIAVVFDRFGIIQLVELNGIGKNFPVKEKRIELEEGEEIFSYASNSSDSIVFSTSLGRSLIVKIDFTYNYRVRNSRDRPTVQTSLSYEFIEFDTMLSPMKFLAINSGETLRAIVGNIADKQIFVLRKSENTGLFADDNSTNWEVNEISLDITGEVSSLSIDEFAENLFVGTSSGDLLWYSFSGGEFFEKSRVFAATNSLSAVTSSAFLLGERKLIVGNDLGEITGWMEVRDSDSQKIKLRKTNDYGKLESSINSIVSSPRTRDFLAVSKLGELFLCNGTNGRTAIEKQIEAQLIKRRLVSGIFAPKGQSIYSIIDGDVLASWSIESTAFSNVSLASLFQKTHYEGYEEPEHVWQSSGGSDAFEPKLGLLPLIFGTFKATIYGMLVAIPLALLSAIYTSQFLHPKVKAFVKPIIELSAAVPSVVIGLLAGIWLAPKVEMVICGIFILPIILSIFIGVHLFLKNKFTFIYNSAVSELISLLFLIASGCVLSVIIGGGVESLFFAGDFPLWLQTSLDLKYDQRNCLVVGIAMGLAVIPIIFTISEDCLSSVPKSLIAASLALGANRWQTAIKVVVPAASVGIFSAVIIGFGRAVGETMIVLMASGNTPIMDFSIFNGLRALSANIAVEMPEAPHGGALYRILFFSAFLLFIFTFVINSFGELVRSRMKKNLQGQ